jgi:N-acetylglutamate synthase-like GNAT family acetyltransferase
VIERTHASQIAELLNKQNRLSIKYDTQRVLDHANEYLVDFSEDGRVVCCAQLKRVQWYQAEILHVTTHLDFVRQGRGGRLIEAAEQRAREDGARLLQCTYGLETARARACSQRPDSNVARRFATLSPETM